MKVTMKNCAPCLSGTMDGLVYYGNKSTNNVYARRYVKPRYTEVNKKLGLATKHLCSINVPDEFVNELKRYVVLHNANITEDEKPIRSSHNLFIKLMYAQAKALGIDILDLNWEMVESQDLPCRSVQSAIEAGLLTEVTGM
ncbi:MAG TPA: hypothetical protein GX398_07230 [Candidatus Cloacimonetes bacterium]|nr:hypothetical protein [Candidatus Cloacimonadota bacterium]